MSDPQATLGLRRDLSAFAELGCALWADDLESDQIMTETLSAVALMGFSRDRLVEKASSALLQRAMKQEGNANAAYLNQPFFRLPIEARFVLSALHLGRWSYARLARILDCAPDAVEELAWSARTQLATSVSKLAIGGKTVGMNCPEYDVARPWTQRFLDEEIRSGQDRLFLQNHLMACDSCQRTLNHCRDLYFAVERILPRTEGAEVDRFEKLCRVGRELKGRKSEELDEVVTPLKRFFMVLRAPDVVLVLAISIGLIAFQYFLNHRPHPPEPVSSYVPVVKTKVHFAAPSGR